MKKYFITGLIILLPLALTIVIISFIFNLLTAPFLGLVNTFFDHYGLFERGFLFLNADQLQNLIAQLLILSSLLIITIALGFIVRWFFFRSLIKLAEFTVKKIPFVSAIYKTCNDVIKTIFTTQNKSFKQVVLVRFPNSTTLAIGLVTAESIPSLKDTPYQGSMAVFVPTTPNPTSGFLIMFRRDDLIYLDMKVEEAFKYIISCGLITPNFNIISREEAFDHIKEEVIPLKQSQCKEVT